MARQKKGRTRANGEGSITRRKDGRYDCEMPVYTPEGTKRLRTTKKTKAEADEWLTTTKYERNAGTPMNLEADKMRFGEYLDRWLRDVVKGSVARHTYKDYEGKVRLPLKPTLGRVRLKDLTSAHLQALYRQKTEDGLSPRTVEYIHSTARKALAKAEEWDLVRKNVARYARPPAKEHKEHRTLTVPQSKAFFAAAAGGPPPGLLLLAPPPGGQGGGLLGV